nr:hypothetical transcript [Hymenolepis microstoma]
MVNWIKAFVGQRKCKVGYGSDLSKSNLLQTSLPQEAVTACSLFNVLINDIAELVQTVKEVKCLLYADDLVLWYSAPKKDPQKRTEIALNYAPKILSNWCDNNGMVVNTSKTAYQTFSLAHRSISTHLMYKDTSLEQTNEFTYLRVTFDTKLIWKNHTAKIAERASNRLDVLKRFAGSLWGSERSTLNTTYKMFVQLIMQLYCYETLITASEAILKPLEKTHNQALRIITGEIKSKPIDAMLLVTGNNTFICRRIRETTANSQ